MVSKEVILEKMKDLGLRHGEKAGVLIASMIFFVCVGMAAVMPTINTTPEKVKQVTQQSESNLTRREDRDTIVKNLEAKGIKDNNFTKLVDDQVKTALVSDEYKPARVGFDGTGRRLDSRHPGPDRRHRALRLPWPRGDCSSTSSTRRGERIADTGTDKSKDQPLRKRRRRRRNPGNGGRRYGRRHDGPAKEESDEEQGRS